MQKTGYGEFGEDAIMTLGAGARAFGLVLAFKNENATPFLFSIEKINVKNKNRKEVVLL